MSQNKLKPLSKKTDIVIQEFNNEILIYDLTTHKAFSLNETSALVWQACDGNKTVSEISEQVGKQVKSPVTDDFVWLALEQLKKDNLLENSETISTGFDGMSRREVIRRVAVTTLAALPLVSSLVAPLAVNAASLTCAKNNCLCPPATPAAGFCNTTAPGAAIGPNPGVVVCGGSAPPSTPTCRCTGPFSTANPPSTGATAQQLGSCNIFP